MSNYHADLLLNCVTSLSVPQPCTLLEMGIQIFLMVSPTLGAITICVGLQSVLSLTFIKLACKYELNMNFVRCIYFFLLILEFGYENKCTIFLLKGKMLKRRF